MLRGGAWPEPACKQVMESGGIVARQGRQGRQGRQRGGKLVWQLPWMRKCTRPGLASVASHFTHDGTSRQVPFTLAIRR